MSALYNQIRRFFRSNITWNNVLFQWFTMGTIALIIVTFLLMMGPRSISSIEGIISWFSCILFTWIAASFYNDVIEEPLPGREQFVTRKFNEFLYWCGKMTTPASIGEFQGRPVLEIWPCIDLRRIYDRDGYLVAFEQEFDWPMSDPNWRPGDVREIETKVTPVTSGERLPWLARLRSPKLPTGKQALVLDVNDEIVDTTSFNER